MNILGISAGFHDAGASVINTSGDILFASHSERYSKQKHDSNLCEGIVEEATAHGVDHVAYYERPWLKQVRRLISGEGFDWAQTNVNNLVFDQLGRYANVPVSTHNHHLSHAAAGFQTSPFERATVVVVDAIGELDCITIWGAEYKNGRAVYKKLWTRRYPHSIGLMYSAATAHIGLRPMDEEYILMGMAAYADKEKVRHYSNQLSHKLVADFTNIKLKHNLRTGFDGVLSNELSVISDADMAGSIQAVTETLLNSVMWNAANFHWSKNLVFMGGVALNCLANRLLGSCFDDFWIMPNPGDAGSSLGAAALVHGGKLNWQHPYLGHNIPGEYPVKALVKELAKNKIAGVASGRAEFGPRALGNRSLLADPRGKEIKDRVNEIKRRQHFRPFAPAILAEHVHDYFEMPKGWQRSDYMQVVARCTSDKFPAILHADGTSRVQTVPADSGSGFRKLLEAWYKKTGCPMLLNTSLNIRGEPMVNDRADADRFETEYGVRVLS